ncbi:acyl-CoA dehydrogenase [Cryptococcus wingfieldii CBS 7118]|uniref:Acyl-CoA dehydrogenase n=1 Tax=Cryptococcus wingfieldii CBS 7118 TaxID=1295528 RepID=A0A1E3JR55_9TREE|nr:acyl-CoA dehydrogenase [Cryptococcus wingfieldii CBS 7118]ODO03361.1 acyl-CoA dehydrogenase [Cryptococcus wingfieldii CBS 7118]
MGVQPEQFAQLKDIPAEEVATHNKQGDIWIIIDAVVYDLSKFANLHPGGLGVLLDGDVVAGKDATTVFFSLHRQEVLLKPQYQRLIIGRVAGSTQSVSPPAIGAISTVPYGEPTWLTPQFKSPYYNDSHRKFQMVVRKFVEEEIKADAQACEESGKRASKEVLAAMARVNLNAMRLGPGKHLHGRSLFDGAFKGEEFDYFHELIITQELARTGARGYADGLNAGMVIGLPPVLNFGQEPLRSKVVEEVFKGEKVISLAISEAFAGSDVAGLRTTATKQGDGWVINGTKKWISGGVHSDYFTVGCRTEGGLTVFLVPRTENVTTKQIKTSYSTAAGTAYITFDNVYVPNENMLGPENGGLLVILSNFNHERWVMCCGSARISRIIVEECLKWASQRRVFGKPLISQPVIRAKLASMIAKVEATQAWLEAVTFQMCNMNYKQQSKNLAGQIAFLKMQSTRFAGEIADDAVNIFGGRGLTKTGMGRLVEQFQRTQKFDAILGGAEEVLGDLGVRQAMRQMPKDVRL